MSATSAPLAVATSPATPAPTAVELLGTAFHEEVVGHFTATTGHDSSHVRHQVRECLRYLYLVSQYPERLGGLFLPVEQEIDEIWHFLILQTREYRELCEGRLPGGYFIHHRSIAYTDYTASPNERAEEKARVIAAEEALRWIPLYTASFGPFDEDALPHWTIVRFLNEQLGLDLTEISALDPSDRTTE
ncbi:hypothetical protein [Streptomyces sp. NPDC023838]|uniref:hypothetical protein n=1 Tax=Streptomyces sp. NPDC023838 TaxID=3154325 RepID=UPI0033E99BCB